MTNEEFKNKNNEYIIQIIKYENAVLECIKEIMKNNISFPVISNNLLIKVNELFDVFQNDSVPLDQHLIVVLESQYLLARCSTNVAGIKKYMDDLMEALNNGDKDQLLFLLKKKEEYEKIWKENAMEIENFDFYNGLEQVINSGMPLPGNMDKKIAINICLNELTKIGYVPKDVNEDKPGRVM